MARRRRIAAVVMLTGLAAVVPAVSGTASTIGLDPSFGAGGIVRFDGDVPEWATAVALQAGGKLVVAGTRKSFTPEAQATVTRLLAGGARDLTFGQRRDVRAGYGSRPHLGHRVAVRPDGRVLVSMSWKRADNGASRVGVVQLTNDGQLDASFGDGGVASGPEGLLVNTERSALALQPDGKVLLASTSRPPRPTPTCTWPASSSTGNPTSGALDPAFGDGGLVVREFTAARDEVMGIAVQPDGKIVAAGHAGDRFTVARYCAEASRRGPPTTTATAPPTSRPGVPRPAPGSSGVGAPAVVWGASGDIPPVVPDALRRVMLLVPRG